MKKRFCLIIGAIFSPVLPLMIFSHYHPEVFLLNIGLLVCMILAWLIFSKVSISDQLGKLVIGMTGITEGNNFGEEIQVTYHDEIGLLISAFNQMNKSFLQKIHSLEEERDLYRTLTQSAEFGIFAADADQKVIFFNEGATRIFGWERNEILNQNVSLLIPQKLRRKYMQAMENYLDDHNSGREIEQGNTALKGLIEVSGLRRSGEEFFMNLSMTGGENAGGRIFTAIVQDITDQKKKEGEIIRQNEKLFLLKQVSTELLFQRDLKKLAEYSLYESMELTDSLCGLFLLRNKDGDFVPLSLLGLENPSDETGQIFKPISILGEIVKQKQPIVINTSARRVSRTVLSFGRFSFFSFLGVPIISDQEVIGIICVGNKIKGYTDKEQNLLVSLTGDISLLIVRNAVEKETLILEEKYRTLFDQSGDMIVICSSEGQVMTVNHRIIQSTGYSYQEIIESALWRLYMPSEERKIKEFFRHAWESGSSRFESVLRQKDGGSFPVDIQGNTITCGNRKVLQVVIRDASDSKQTEQKLRNHIERLMKKLDVQGRERTFFLKAINSLPEYVVFTDQRRRMFFVNEPLCQRLHYHPQELAGASLEGLFHHSLSVDDIDMIIKQALKGGWRGTVAHKTKDDHKVLMDFHLRAMRDPQEGMLGFLGVSQELHEYP
ncbi:MAG: PAS domain S-box protein [bacterium]